jgi:hypothetical protein
MLQDQIQVEYRNTSFDDNLDKSCISHLGQGNKFVPEFGFCITYPDTKVQ